MMTIRDYKDLGLYYLLIHEFTKSLVNMGADVVHNDHLKELKRAVRRFYIDSPDQDRVYLCADYDGYTAKIEVPDDVADDAESRKAWFMSYEYIEPYYTYYDCTGRPFTSWYKFAKLHGAWFCFHHVCYDV